ncbi:hypothetical protein GQ43DRAFT_395047 [Delitschia confertaspora ATCC 74209]|uniref:Meiotically up-regulated gene 154 protein n=1 Tax=Delitschia confertaspora ATCC 74209 TaxID=1513339 RepID=A0A9P4MVE5_9PLEO|nr:hypothetical protein GQ43DRAFT_395047 [Delitschia confertaspora ATCC 74209]
MPRLVRLAPLSERIKAYLDPVDWLMWMSEELNTNDWEDFAKSWAVAIGIGANITFMIARANTGQTYNYEVDDVFSDYYERRGSGWLKWVMNLAVLTLTTLSSLNAFYTFYRTRHYRLYEREIETNPSTPSARRVRVDSSPMASSPLRFLQNIIQSTAESRAHPDATRDVWEISVWDPNPLCLHLFCLFSPGHVLTYFIFLPVDSNDPRPSVRVIVTMIVACLLSVQLLFLRSFFSQQTKDSAIIHREVAHEYDKKFVHPALQNEVRDVGIQVESKRRKSGSLLHMKADLYTPTTVIKRGFRTHPNQSYASQYDPDGLSSKPVRSNVQTPSLRPTTNRHLMQSTGTTTADFSSPIRRGHTPQPVRQPSQPIRQPQFRHSQAGTRDGGSLGVYSHAASPLRKSTSANFSRDESRERRSQGSPVKREGSPLKRISVPSELANEDNRPITTADPFGKGYSRLGDGRTESGRF